MSDKTVFRRTLAEGLANSGGASLAFALVFTFLLVLPLFQMIPLFVAIPLAFVWTEIQSSGELVETGFLWITIKKLWVYAVFFAYYFVVAFLPLSVVSLAEAYGVSRKYVDRSN